MSREQGSWDFEMCPIRHFRQNVVKLLDSHENFVLAVDSAGSFALFWIDEQDQENDEDTLQKTTFELREEPVAMYLYPAEKAPPRRQQKANEVVIVTGRGVHHFEFGRHNQELFLRPLRMIPLPSQTLSNVYSCELAPKVIFASNLPQSYDDFSLDSNIYVYHADKPHLESDN
mmetsp:Transcript_39112/g.51151  ORF Transcript_39112/g.51151 Transcript_39112/m.51151 type:complete len:173 (+) Transcript_39112:320-838(+)